MANAGYSVASASASGAISGLFNNNGAVRMQGQDPMMTTLVTLVSVMLLASI